MKLPTEQIDEAAPLTLEQLRAARTLLDSAPRPEPMFGVYYGFTRLPLPPARKRPLRRHRSFRQRMVRPLK